MRGRNTHLIIRPPWASFTWLVQLPGEASLDYFKLGKDSFTVGLGASDHRYPWGNRMNDLLQPFRLQPEQVHITEAFRLHELVVSDVFPGYFPAHIRATDPLAGAAALSGAAALVPHVGKPYDAKTVTQRPHFYPHVMSYVLEQYLYHVFAEHCQTGPVRKEFVCRLLQHVTKQCVALNRRPDRLFCKQDIVSVQDLVGTMHGWHPGPGEKTLPVQLKADIDRARDKLSAILDTTQEMLAKAPDRPLPKHCAEYTAKYPGRGKTVALRYADWITYYNQGLAVLAQLWMLKLCVLHCETS